MIVSGLLKEAKGVSQGARLSLAAFESAGLAPIAHDLRPLFGGGNGQAIDFPTDASGGVWFIHVNAPEAIHTLGRFRPSDWLNRYRIGFWAYELGRVPEEWVRISRAFHEIWAPSAFVVDALKSSGVITPVRLMPHPVALRRQPVDAPRRAPKEFTVLTLADLRSSATRKNVLGAISIYTGAFPEPARTRLVVKIRDDAAYPAFLTQARRAARERRDIEFVVGDHSASDMRKLISSADLLLSPHRSEGFGLPLAEAFLAGVPVLATGWSGNMDFMIGLPELQIAYSLVPVRDRYHVYRARDQKWAEPDIDDAITKLRALASSADLRWRLAAAGREAVESLSLSWSRAELLAMPLGALVSGATVQTVADAELNR